MVRACTPWRKSPTFKILIGRRIVAVYGQSEIMEHEAKQTDRVDRDLAFPDIPTLASSTGNPPPASSSRKEFRVPKATNLFAVYQESAYPAVPDRTPGFVDPLARALPTGGCSTLRAQSTARASS